MRNRSLSKKSSAKESQHPKQDLMGGWTDLGVQAHTPSHLR
jgi:hypothetical protein